MLEQSEGGGETFHPIVGVPDSAAPVEEAIILDNISRRLDSDLPRLHKWPSWGKFNADPIAIVAGGPSLKRTLPELRTFRATMVCGSAHDHVVGLGIAPTYAVTCDPSELAADYYRRPVPGCKYLIATCCHDAVFDALRGMDVTLWNSAGCDPAAFRGEPAIQGGGTVTLRAINIAIMIGHLDQHFFGVDSSFEDEDHAYDHHAAEDVFKVKLDGERVFKTNVTGLVQALHFQEQLNKTGWMFTPTIHGDSLIAEIVKRRKLKMEKVNDGF